MEKAFDPAPRVRSIRRTLRDAKYIASGSCEARESSNIRSKQMFLRGGQIRFISLQRKGAKMFEER